MPASPSEEPIMGGGVKRESRARKALRIIGTAARDGTEFFNPKAIYGKAREDIAAFRAAKSISDADIAGKPEIISAKIDLKLAAALAISEFIGPYIGAPLGGIGIQELTKNPYLGVAGTIVGDYVPAVLSFTAAWLAFNTSYYSNSAKSLAGKAKQFFRDLRPIFAAGAVAAAPAYLFSAAISSGFIGLLERIRPHLAVKIHVMPLITVMTSDVVAQGIFLALVSGPMMRIARDIAAKYTAYLDKKFVKRAQQDGPLRIVR
jgi:hypothetical protein